MKVKLEMYATVGLPGSGKSTWAKAFVRRSLDPIVRINRDDLRAMLHGGQPWSSEQEALTVIARDGLIRACFWANTSVVVDETNMKPGALDELRAIADFYDAKFIEKDFTAITIEECIARDNRRGSARVGPEVIRKMARYLPHE